MKKVIINNTEYAEHDLKCPECSAPMRLRPSKYGLFYGCSRYPLCSSAHGAHPDGSPLGIPADKKTKEARIRAHGFFDTLWKEEYMSRGDAYKWMQKKMNLEEDDAHIGKFTFEQCREREGYVNEFFDEV